VWQITQRVREKNTALRAKLSRSVLMPVGIAYPVCGHLTMTMPMSPSFVVVIVFAEKHRPVGVRLMSVRLLGGHRAPCLTEHGGSGGFMLGAYSNRPDPSSNDPWT
jgi:hypothetical protein